MQQITEDQFNTILANAERENEERASVGLEPMAVTTKSYGAVASSGELVEYHFAGSMFGFVQNGIHYSNGL